MYFEHGNTIVQWSAARVTGLSACGSGWGLPRLRLGLRNIFFFFLEKSVVLFGFRFQHLREGLP